MRAALIVCTALLLAQQTIGRQREDPAGRDDSGVPAAVLNAERQWGGPDLLLPLAASPDPKTSTYAIRALGRLEEVELIPRLLELLPKTIVDPLSDPIAAEAIAQTLHLFDSQRDPELIAHVAERFRRLADNVDVTRSKAIVPLGRLRYVDPQDVSRAERILTHLLNHTTADLRLLETRIAAARSLESLSRVNSKLVAFEPATTAALTSIVIKPSHNDTPVVRLYALMALKAARATSNASLDAALRDDDEQVRRVAMADLGGPNVRAAARGPPRCGQTRPRGSVCAGPVRVASRLRSRADPGDGLRAVARCPGRSIAARCARSHRCGRRHVQGRPDDQRSFDCRCKNAGGEWTVASRRARARGGGQTVARAGGGRRCSNSALIRVWQVRMYAARAAAAMRDTASLEALAGDRDDNVREATLGPLQKLGSNEAEPALIAALSRPDYQLLRTAALLLDGPADRAPVAPAAVGRSSSSDPRGKGNLSRRQAGAAGRHRNARRAGRCPD